MELSEEGRRDGCAQAAINLGVLDENQTQTSKAMELSEEGMRDESAYVAKNLQDLDKQQRQGSRGDGEARVIRVVAESRRVIRITPSAGRENVK